MPSLYLIGDIHGMAVAAQNVLHKAELIDVDGHWMGGDAHLWFMGDLVDRGSESIAVIEMVMRLQTEARAAGGEVGCLLGNHEVLFLSAYRHRARQNHVLFRVWRRNGGALNDMRDITPEQVAWLSALPALARWEDWLLMHADALFYTHYGDNILEINARIREAMQTDRALEMLIEGFTERMAFIDSKPGSPLSDVSLSGDSAGIGRARYVLSLMGAKRLAHGHTPIQYLLQQDDDDPVAEIAVHEPLIYAGGLCVNMDGGLYIGGAGFVLRADTLDEAPMLSKDVEK